MNLTDDEVLIRRGNRPGNNGLKFVLVEPPDVAANQAVLELHFFQPLAGEDAIRNMTAEQLGRVFAISGGLRLPGGNRPGDVRVTAALSYDGATRALRLGVAPIGDYSTYTLTMQFAGIDPLLCAIPFKFRPGCFNLNRPANPEPARPPAENPSIDYLAKDFDSFRHTLITAMMRRVPGWQPTSEADLDMVLLELFSAAADELSDYQDRVMNEAFLTSARKRVSLARHARLMDYHIHQGQQAATVVALRSVGGADVAAADFACWTGARVPDAGSQIFIAREPFQVYGALNTLRLYSWGGAVSGLAAGSVEADLEPAGAADPAKAAVQIQNLVRQGLVKRLLIQEWLDPETGRAVGSDPARRQVLELAPGDEGAAAGQDPVTKSWYVRVRWLDRDRLRADYRCYYGDRETVLFHGNLADVLHGAPRSLVFQEPGTRLADSSCRYLERTRWGTLCRLDEDMRLAYTQTAPGGEAKPVSTLRVTVLTPSGQQEEWAEQIGLIHSFPDDAHFIVETDERKRSLIRFGNGQNGRALPVGAEVTCWFQAGEGSDGNVGQDKLVFSSESALECWNPFDVTSGRDQEPVAEIVRRVPEAYLRRQLRAVTLADYEKRAQEIPEVSRAMARYFWTGSWRTVRLLIDTAGGAELTPKLRRKILDYLEPVRLAGEDLEIRAPQYVPLRIKLAVQVDDQYWPEDIQALLEREFSNGFTADGRMGFFHPDAWTFGQALHASQLAGRAQALEGVDHVVAVEFERFDRMTGVSRESVPIQPSEIVQVENDPDQMEKGFVTFNLQGGRK